MIQLNRLLAGLSKLMGCSFTYMEVLIILRSWTFLRSSCTLFCGLHFVFNVDLDLVHVIVIVIFIVIVIVAVLVFFVLASSLSAVQFLS